MKPHTIGPVAANLSMLLALVVGPARLRRHGVPVVDELSGRIHHPRLQANGWYTG